MKPARVWCQTLAVSVLAGLLLAACGGGGDSDSTPPAQPVQNPPPQANRAPTISGQPATTVRPGDTYSFQPTASDPDGNTLTFSVSALPDWLDFDTSNGRLSGTPDDSAVGTTSPITISVSDGQATASLPAFTIAVVANASGSASVSWTPPTENTDGSPLTNLAGYRIVYGRSASDLNQSVTINNPSLSRYVIDNLTAGTWYFSVIAINSSGVESSPSNTASKTI